MIGSLSNHWSRKSPAERVKSSTRSRCPSSPSERRRFADFGGVDEGAETRGEPLSRRHIGRRLKRERAQNVGHALEPRLVGVEPLGVAGGEFCDFGLRAPRRDFQIAPVGQGQEIRQRALDDAEAVAMKIEVADDLRVQERDGVGGDGIAEAGMEFLGDRRAADLRPALEHRDLEAGHGEIGRGDKAVVTAADDDDVRHQDRGGRSRAPVQGRPHASPSPRGKGGASTSPSGEGGPMGRMRATPR